MSQQQKAGGMEGQVLTYTVVGQQDTAAGIHKSCGIKQRMHSTGCELAGKITERFRCLLFSPILTSLDGLRQEAL